jgi:membrane protease YdiL (CAAX protease family)
MINKKALATFLMITFGLTISAVIIAKSLGFTLVGIPAFMSQMVIMMCMFFPAIGAIFTQKFILHKPLKELGFKLGSWRMYVKVYGLIVFMFIINYTLTWIFVTKPDVTLNSFMNQFSAIKPITLPLPAPVMITLFAGITFLAAPVFNMIPSLGEEIGWRGFLLPNLEPMGKVKAMVFSGMIWALWHTPMILILGFTYGTQAWPGAILHFITVTGLGIWMGHIWFKTRSTILAGFIHAVFNANAYGIWAMIFVSRNKLMVGGAGLIGALLCLLLGVVTIYKVQANYSVEG